MVGCLLGSHKMWKELMCEGGAGAAAGQKNLFSNYCNDIAQCSGDYLLVETHVPYHRVQSVAPKMEYPNGRLAITHLPRAKKGRQTTGAT